MKRPWLCTDIGLNSVAIGIVAVVFAIPFILVRDVGCLIIGRWPEWAPRHEVESAIFAGVSALFSVANFFIFRPGLPKVVTLILAVSFASYLVQWFVPVHDQRLTLLCVARLAGFSSLALLLLEQQRTPNSGQ